MPQMLDTARDYEKHITANGTFYVQDGKKFAPNQVQIVKKNPKRSPRDQKKTLKMPETAPPVPDPEESPD